MSPTFFATPAAFRVWLQKHHAKHTELLVGFHKTDSGVPSITWPQSVDEALCFGWIDGVRKRIDETRYQIRFTPRKPGSIWSAINIAKVASLEREGRMTPAGRAAFEGRKAERSAIYSHEQKSAAALPKAYAAKLAANPKASAWFAKAPPSYRKAAIWWVVTAKQEATQLKRLETLIADSAAGRTVKPLSRPTPKKR